MTSSAREQLAQLRELLRADDPDVVRQGLMLFEALDDPALADGLLRGVRVEPVPALPSPRHPQLFGRTTYQRLVPNAAFRGRRTDGPRLERLLLSVVARAPAGSRIADHLRAELRRLRLRMPEHEDGFELADLAGLELELLHLFRPRDLEGIDELATLGELEVDTSAATLDFAPLSAHPSLRSLRVIASARMRVVGSVGTRLMNADALATLPLRELRLRHLVGLDDIAFLAAMPLQTLEILNAPGASLAPLAELERLHTLSLSRVAGSELAVLTRLPELRELHLAHLGLAGDTFRGLPHLRRLQLRQLSNRQLHLGELPALERAVVRECAVLEELSLGPSLARLWRLHVDRCARLETIGGGRELPALLDVQAQRTPKLSAIARPEPALADLVNHPDPGLRTTLVTRLPLDGEHHHVEQLARDENDETATAAARRLLDAGKPGAVLSVVEDEDAPGTARARAALLLVPRRQPGLAQAIDGALASADRATAATLLAARAALGVCTPPPEATLDREGERWLAAARAVTELVEVPPTGGTLRLAAASAAPPGRRLQLARLTAADDLADVDHLVLDELEVGPGGQLPRLPALQTLELRRTNLRDLRPLAHLHNLRSLHILRGRTLRALDGIESLDSLSAVRILESRISDLSPLAGHCLRRVILPDARVRTLSPLKGCRDSLEYLDLTGSPLRSLEPLRGAKVLQTLILDGASIARSAPLASLTSLRELSIRGCAELDGFAFLTALSRLVRLDLADTAFDDIVALFSLPELQVLRAIDTPIARDRRATDALHALLARRGGDLRRGSPLG